MFVRELLGRHLELGADDLLDLALDLLEVRDWRNLRVVGAGAAGLAAAAITILCTDDGTNLALRLLFPSSRRPRLAGPA